MITLHTSDSTNFTTLGIGSLPNYIGGIVTEEINGQYELTFQYPVNGVRYNDIKMREIVCAKPNPYSKPQPFRIYSISKPINKIVTINACHISYDLTNYPTNEFVSNSAKDTMTKLKANAQVAHNFTFNSTSSATGEVKVESPRTTRSVLGNNVLAAYGGDYEFDNFMVYHFQNRGMDRGVTVRYGKNLLTLEQEENISNVYTGVYPYWVGIEPATETTPEKRVIIRLPEKIVNTPGTFNFTKILPLDMGEYFNDEPTAALLKEKTLWYINKEKLGIPKISLEVSFIQLTKSSEYEKYAILEQIMLGDIVLVEFNELRVNSTARCIKTIYNISTDIYDSIQLGESKSNLADSISESNKGMADKIEQQKVVFDSEIGTIKIDLAHIDEAIIGKADIGWVNANYAHITNGFIDIAQIKDASIGTAQIGDAQITVAKIQDAFIESLVAKEGKFESAQIGELTANNIAAGAIKAEKIAAGAITTDKLQAKVITADKIAVNAVTAEKIAAGAITTDKLQAKVITADKIAADTITANNIAANAITTSELAANSVTSDKITAGSITSDKITANSVTSDKITAGSITATKIAANAVEARHIKAGAIDAEKITAGAIEAISISAGSLVANDIAAGKIKVTNANILDASISGAKITNATITNAQIANATIDSAKIKDLNASKITAGILDASKVAINSTSGRLSISDNTITIKDAQTTPKVRVQVGLDSRGQYGIIVLNAVGKAIFDSDKGVLIPEGLSSNVITTDKIKDEAVTPSKIQIDELIANKIFVDNISAINIDASQITTGKISNERIDISGLVSFESFDDDIQKLFIPNGDKTFINGGFIGTGSITANSIDLYSGLSVKGPDGSDTFAIADNGEITINGLLRSGNYKQGISGYRVETNGNAEFNQAIIRGNIILPNTGITNEGTSATAIRIWAGAAQENKELAPFKVLQNGSLTALDGTFSGKLYGELNVGIVHIHDDSIEINRTKTFVDAKGVEMTASPRDGNNNGYLRLGTSQSYFNQDVIFGTVNSRKIQYSNEAGELILNKSTLVGESTNGSIRINNQKGSNNHFTGISFTGKTGGAHMIGYYDVASFLKFESSGNATHSSGKEYDFVFEGANARVGKIVTLIDGSVTISKSLQSNNQNIEMRSVSNEGWGFFAT